MSSSYSTSIRSTAMPEPAMTAQKPLPYDHVQGLDFLDKVIEIDQAPIGRTPRSNPATYTNVFSDIRKIFSNLPEAKIRERWNGSRRNIIGVTWLRIVMPLSVRSLGVSAMISASAR